VLQEQPVISVGKINKKKLRVLHAPEAGAGSR